MFDRPSVWPPASTTTLVAATCALPADGTGCAWFMIRAILLSDAVVAPIHYALLPGIREGGGGHSRVDNVLGHCPVASAAEVYRIQPSEGIHPLEDEVLLRPHELVAAVHPEVVDEFVVVKLLHSVPVLLHGIQHVSCSCLCF